MTNGIRFGRSGDRGGRIHHAQSGDPSNPLAVRLRGFPEYRAAWREVVLALADWFHVMSPDRRGFDLSFKPNGIDACRTRRMRFRFRRACASEARDKAQASAGLPWRARTETAR